MKKVLFEKNDVKEDEIWKDIGVVRGIDFTGYYKVSNFGNVKTVPRYFLRKDGRHYLAKERQKAKRKTKDGYLEVTLIKGGEHISIGIHRLVALTFIPNPDPEHKTQVNHIDEDKTNNCVKNLEWVSIQENCNYGSRNSKILETKLNRAVPIIQLDYNGNIINVYYQTKDIEKWNPGFSHKTILDKIRRENYLYKDYIWMRLDKYNELSFDELLDFIKNRLETANSKPVIQLDLNGNFINQFNSMDEAAKSINGCPGNLQHCLRGKTKTYKGYKWIYLKDW